MRDDVLALASARAKDADVATQLTAAVKQGRGGAVRELLQQTETAGPALEEALLELRELARAQLQEVAALSLDGAGLAPALQRVSSALELGALYAEATAQVKTARVVCEDLDEAFAQALAVHLHESLPGLQDKPKEHKALSTALRRCVWSCGKWLAWRRPCDAVANRLVCALGKVLVSPSCALLVRDATDALLHACCRSDHLREALLVDLLVHLGDGKGAKTTQVHPLSTLLFRLCEGACLPFEASAPRLDDVAQKVPKLQRWLVRFCLLLCRRGLVDADRERGPRLVLEVVCQDAGKAAADPLWPGAVLVARALAMHLAQAAQDQFPCGKPDAPAKEHALRLLGQLAALCAEQVRSAADDAKRLEDREVCMDCLEPPDVTPPEGEPEGERVECLEPGCTAWVHALCLDGEQEYLCQRCAMQRLAMQLLDADECDYPLACKVLVAASLSEPLEAPSLQQALVPQDHPLPARSFLLAQWAHDCRQRAEDDDAQAGFCVREWASWQGRDGVQLLDREGLLHCYRQCTARPLQDVRGHALKCVLEQTRSKQPSLRRQAVKQLAAVGHADPQLLDGELGPVLKQVVEARLLDEAAPVRAQAVDLLGQWRPGLGGLQGWAVQLLRQRSQDVSLLVRKQSTLLLILELPSCEEPLGLCTDLLRRLDDSDQLRTKVLDAIADLYLCAGAPAEKVVELALLAFRARQWGLDLMREMLGKASSRCPRETLAQWVQVLFHRFVQPVDKPERQALLAALHALSEVQPLAVAPFLSNLWKGYLHHDEQALASADDQQIAQQVAKILTCVVPHCPGLPPLGDLERELVVQMEHQPSGLAREAARCFVEVAKRTKNHRLAAALLTRHLKVLKQAEADAANPAAVQAAPAARAGWLLATLLEGLDLAPLAPLLPPGFAVLQCAELLFALAQVPQLRVALCSALGFLLGAHRELLLLKQTRQLFEGLLQAGECKAVEALAHVLEACKRGAQADGPKAGLTWSECCQPLGAHSEPVAQLLSGASPPLAKACVDALRLLHDLGLANPVKLVPALVGMQFHDAAPLRRQAGLVLESVLEQRPQLLLHRCAEACREAFRVVSAQGAKAPGARELDPSQIQLLRSIYVDQFRKQRASRERFLRGVLEEMFLREAEDWAPDQQAAYVEFLGALILGLLRPVSVESEPLLVAWECENFLQLHALALVAELGVQEASPSPPKRRRKGGSPSTCSTASTASSRSLAEVRTVAIASAGLFALRQALRQEYKFVTLSRIEQFDPHAAERKEKPKLVAEDRPKLVLPRFASCVQPMLGAQTCAGVASELQALIDEEDRKRR